MWFPRTPLIPCFSVQLWLVFPSHLLWFVSSAVPLKAGVLESSARTCFSPSAFTHGDISPLMANDFQIRTFSLTYSSELWATHSPDIPLYMFNGTLTIFRAHTTFSSPSNLLLFKVTSEEGGSRSPAQPRLKEFHLHVCVCLVFCFCDKVLLYLWPRLAYYL